MTARDLVLAGVDIGTLTCRLLIARVTPDNHLQDLHGERRILRLGEGVARDRRLRDDAMARVIETLAEWRAVIARYRPEAEIAVATSAVRDATNREEFGRRVLEETGFAIEIIDGEEEARRTMLGIAAGLTGPSQDLLGLDIGGGSTELILARAGQPLIVRSMDVGVVRLTELALHGDPPSHSEREHAVSLVREALAAARPALGPLRGTALVGTAGTITTLAAMAQRLASYSRAQVHNYILNGATIEQLERDLFSRNREQRRGMAGLEAGREDVILAGTLILKTVMSELGFADCVVSDFGLREGVVIELAGRVRAKQI